MIVEDGTGLSNSESYCSELFADTYHENRTNNDWNLVPDKEAALRKATDYMIQVFRSLWTGYRFTTTQALDWPRGGVYLNDFAEEISIATNVVPIEIKNACAELALKTYTDSLLLEDSTQKIIKETIGSISTEYSDKSTIKYKQYSSVIAILKPYLRNMSSRVIR